MEDILKKKPDYVIIYETNDVHNSGGYALSPAVSTLGAIRTAMNNAAGKLVLMMPDVVYAIPSSARTISSGFTFLGFSCAEVELRSLRFKFFPHRSWQRRKLYLQMIPLVRITR